MMTAFKMKTIQPQDQAFWSSLLTKSIWQTCHLCGIVENNRNEIDRFSRIGLTGKSAAREWCMMPSNDERIPIVNATKK